ncbi:hypothetical protein EJ05DRAFT_82964 [Pseudovirgaria hyperparasitica]|uniref:Uncharacterized protein n=1 Tax=Pseudovirgaria hyperparasitica TaxID=470096 RepID=A0A6A6W2X4_9PEZI|nr:uncharacterized protein EJ05DRAFT_82964 [Pseudovirgaria hyperparasitica]KAF2755937.1 hypothetical protein EJ05DRAFT_82964 [Pseudovirgaria hyperparasitica]
MDSRSWTDMVIQSPEAAHVQARSAVSTIPAIVAASRFPPATESRSRSRNASKGIKKRHRERSELPAYTQPCPQKDVSFDRNEWSDGLGPQKCAWINYLVSRADEVKQENAFNFIFLLWAADENGVAIATDIPIPKTIIENDVELIRHLKMRLRSARGMMRSILYGAEPVGSKMRLLGQPRPDSTYPVLLRNKVTMDLDHHIESQKNEYTNLLLDREFLLEFEFDVDEYETCCATLRQVEEELSQIEIFPKLLRSAWHNPVLAEGQGIFRAHSKCSPVLRFGPLNYLTCAKSLSSPATDFASVVSFTQDMNGIYFEETLQFLPFIALTSSASLAAFLFARWIFSSWEVGVGCASLLVGVVTLSVMRHG